MEDAGGGDDKDNDDDDDDNDEVDDKRVSSNYRETEILYTCKRQACAQPPFAFPFVLYTAAHVRSYS